VEISKYPDDKDKLQKSYKSDSIKFPDDEKILLFNGLLDYKPNLDALMLILKQINPVLVSISKF
jgi:hypothetical protein